MPGKVPPSWSELGAELQQETFRHSVRVLILLALGTNGRLGFSDLLVLTQVGKGSLSHHLKQLEAVGFVSVRTVLTFVGPRVLVTITPEGEAAYARLAQVLSRIMPGNRRPTVTVGSAAEPSH